MKKRMIILTVMLIGMVGIAVANNKDGIGVTIPTVQGNMRIIPLADNAVRIKLYFMGAPELDELIYTEKVKAPKYKFDESNPAVYSLNLKGMRVTYDKMADKLTFYDGKGKKILEEVAVIGREITSSSLGDGNNQWKQVSQSFV